MIDQMLLIEDPRKHSEETRDRLRQLLESGAPARPDHKRAGLFEIEDHDQVFYVYVSKSTGKHTLLAVWDKDDQTRRVA